MSEPAAGAAVRPDAPRHRPAVLQLTDPQLLAALLTLVAFGLVMVGSASIGVAEQQHGQPFYFLMRQAVYVAIGLVCALGVLYVPTAVWQRLGTLLVTAGILLLVAVLVPGLGRHVNGSARWLPLGLMQLQVSEPVKLFVDRKSVV